MFAGSKVVEHSATAVVVHVAIAVGGRPAALTTDTPAAATQSTTLGVGCSVARNTCIAYSCMRTSRYTPVAADCGYPAILGAVTSGHSRRDYTRRLGFGLVAGPLVALNATATIHPANASLIVLATAEPLPSGFVPLATSYGRGAWPMTVFFGRSGGGSWSGRKASLLPVIPWFANFTATNAWSPPVGGWG